MKVCAVVFFVCFFRNLHRLLAVSSCLAGRDSILRPTLLNAELYPSIILTPLEIVCIFFFTEQRNAHFPTNNKIKVVKLVFAAVRGSLLKLVYCTCGLGQCVSCIAITIRAGSAAWPLASLWIVGGGLGSDL